MRMIFLGGLAWLLCAMFPAQAQTSVRLLETFPAGDDIALPTGKTVYLRIGYETARPTRIWVRPYYQGRPVDAGSSPSREYSGKGELLGFFFLMAPGHVDELRVTAGDGSRAGTPEIARWPIRVSAYSHAPPPPPAEPAWLGRMLEADKQARDAAFKVEMAKPVPAGELFLFTGFMWLMLGIGLLGLGWPAWGIWKWRGRWRGLAMLPAAVTGFVVLRILLATMVDPSSHNLWPFEVLMAGGFSVLVMLVLVAARRLLAKPG